MYCVSNKFWPFLYCEWLWQDFLDTVDTNKLYKTKFTVHTYSNCWTFNLILASVASTMPPASAQGSGPTPPTSSSAPSGGPPPPSSGTTGSSASGPVGPDGFDESSQQSTLSQSSDRSDGRQTPKGPGQTGPQHPQQAGGGPQGHPHNFMGNFGHGQAPGSPHSSAPSPGGSMGSSGAGPDGGYPRDGMASPSWQRPPASPVSTPQVCWPNAKNTVLMLLLCVLYTQLS